MSSRKANIPINSVAYLVASIFAAAVVLTIVVPLLQSTKGNTMCIGPWKATASMIADMTGQNIC